MALLGLLFALLGVIWSLLRVIWGLLLLIFTLLALLARSWEPLGSFLGLQKPYQIPPGSSPGGPPHRSLIFEPFWEPSWLDFETPRSSKNKVFVWKVLHFPKNRGVLKNT